MQTFELSSKQGCLWYDSNGSQQRFLLKGINWFGCGMHLLSVYIKKLPDLLACSQDDRVYRLYMLAVFSV